MCAREEHPLKAERMVSKSLGSDTSVSFSQSEAKSAGRILVPVESLMETRLGQCVNVEPLKKGPPFTSTRSSFSQERKAPSSTCSIVLGRITSVRLVPAKAFGPMIFSPSGKTTPDSFSSSQNDAGLFFDGTAGKIR